MLKGIKVKIYPTKAQESYINDLLGSYRFVYNKCLEKKIEVYTNEAKSLRLKELGKFFHQDLTKREDFIWLTKHNTHCLKQAVIDLLDAYKRFFVNGSGFPKFKSKKDVQSCRFPVTGISKKTFENNRVNLVKQLKGLRYRCSPNYKKILAENNGKIKSATLSKDKTGTFWISFLVDVEIEKLPKPKYPSVGLDLGINTFITTSRAEKIDNLRSIRNNGKKLKRLNQNLSKTVKGSANREKARLRLAKFHKKLTNTKNTYIHQTTKKLIQENQVICIEDLNVAGMMKNHNLARSIQELSLFETKRQLEYKADFYDRDIIKIDRFYPSSQICSRCGSRNTDLKLSDRLYICKECGNEICRDENASKNIEAEGFRISKLVGSCCSEFKPVDSALMDDRKKLPKKSTMYEAGSNHSDKKL